MKILKKIFFGFLSLIALLALAYILGPKAEFEDFDNIPLSGTYDLNIIDNMIDDSNREADLKDGNGEKIVWNSGKHMTEYAVVYLHGFSASHEEGAPIHKNIADFLKANLFLSRLPAHGIKDVDAFETLTPKQMVEYAKDAIKIGKSIGEKVILMSCSTGGTLSAYLAANDPDIEALIMFSPNFELQDKTSKLLTKQWGLKIARMVKKGKYHSWPAPERAQPYWYNKYRLEGILALQSLLDQTMTEDIFHAITQPVFTGYFYKDEEVKDFTVSVDKIKEVEKLIQTPESQKRFIAYPDGKAHVFISPLFNENWNKAEQDVRLFLHEVLDYHDEMTEEMMLEEIEN